MGFLKFAVVFVALFACACAVSTTWGSRNSTDLLLFSQTVLRNPIALTIQSADVVFPANGQTNTRRISGIFVTDRFTNSSGATNSLWSGGVGSTFATVNLRSQMGQGINSLVEIWGR